MTGFNCSSDYWCPDGKFYLKQCEYCRIRYKTPNDFSTLCKRCYNGFRESEEKKEEIQTIPPEILKRIIILCHPDKHNNSEMSLKVTKFLLDLRGAK